MGNLFKQYNIESMKSIRPTQLDTNSMYYDKNDAFQLALASLFLRIL